MPKTALILATALGCAMSFSSASAADGKADPLARYDRTGQFENCLPTRSIRQSRILNSRQILFELRNDVAYLAEPENCTLSTDYALTYDAGAGELCSTTIIRLVDLTSSVPNRGACSIERFELLAKKPK